MTLRELLDELNIAESTFHDWKARKIAPPGKRMPNGKLRFRRSDVEAWFDALPEVAA